MRRAALLPSPGDPFLLAYWLRNFRCWAGQVDELRVLVNAQADPAANAHMRELVLAAHPDAHVKTVEARVDHGVALAELVEETGCELVLFCEDDAYVREPAAVGRMFDLVERGECDVVGSPRGSASMELLDLCWQRWPEVARTASCDEGHGLWPCFLFARRDDLRATDRRFGAQHWLAGTPIPGLGVTMDAVMSADTFGASAWQLRAAGLEIRHEPQFRIADAGFIEGWLGLEPPWFHVGSLSSGYGCSFGAGHQLDTARDHTPAWEWARRACWWRRFWETAGESALALPELHAAYGAALDEFVALTGTAAMIPEWTDLVRGWPNWPERDG